MCGSSLPSCSAESSIANPGGTGLPAALNSAASSVKLFVGLVDSFSRYMICRCNSSSGILYLPELRRLFHARSTIRRLVLLTRSPRSKQYRTLACCYLLQSKNTTEDRHRKTHMAMGLQCQKLLPTNCFGKHGMSLHSKSSPCSKLLGLSNLRPEAQGSSGQAYHQSIAATQTGTIPTKAQL